MSRKSSIPEGLNIAELVNALCLTVYDYRPDSHSEKVIDAVRDPERSCNIYNPELPQFRYVLPDTEPRHYEQPGYKTRAERGHALNRNDRMPDETRALIELNCMKFALTKLGLLEEIDQRRGYVKTERSFTPEIADAIHLSGHGRDLGDAMDHTFDLYMSRASNRGAHSR